MQLLCANMIRSPLRSKCAFVLSLSGVALVLRRGLRLRQHRRCIVLSGHGLEVTAFGVHTFEFFPPLHLWWLGPPDQKPLSLKLLDLTDVPTNAVSSANLFFPLKRVMQDENAFVVKELFFQFLTSFLNVQLLT